MVIIDFEHCLNLYLSNYFQLFLQVYFQCTVHSFILMHLRSLLVVQMRQIHNLLFFLFYDHVRHEPYQKRDIWIQIHWTIFNQSLHFLGFLRKFYNHFQAILPLFYLTKQLQQFFLSYDFISFSLYHTFTIFIIFQFFLFQAYFSKGFNVTIISNFFPIQFIFSFMQLFRQKLYPMQSLSFAQKGLFFNLLILCYRLSFYLPQITNVIFLFQLLQKLKRIQIIILKLIRQYNKIFWYSKTIQQNGNQNKLKEQNRELFFMLNITICQLKYKMYKLNLKIILHINNLKRFKIEMSLAFDQYGRPFIVIKEQDSKIRIKGVDAIKRNILAAKSVANTLRSSLGPKGLDKLLVSADQEVTVTNDGATIVDKMQIQHPVARLLVELSKSQDNQVGDGTTGVVVLAGALLEQAQKLLDKGLHPLKISDGYDIAVDIATKRLQEISEQIKFSKQDYSELVDAACVSLGSKIVSKDQKKFGEIAVRAVLDVADLQRKDVNLDLIKIQEKTGGSIQDTQLIQGILIDKDFSHPQMPKQVRDAKIAILTCPFQAPKPKTKHNIDITSAESFRKLYQLQQKYFKDMIQHLQKNGCNVALCQWGFQDQANHLLLQSKLPAVRWVGGVDIELIAMATGARIIPRFQQVTAEKLGKAGRIRQLHFGTGDEKMLVIEECSNCKAVTILVRGGSKMIVEEAKRSLHDALCVVSTLIRCNKIVWGGGASEIACSLAVSNYANTIDSTEQYAVRAFADALEQIPMALAENSGLNSLKSLSQSKSKQAQTNQPNHGIDCTSKGSTDMREQKVFETLLSKKGQLQLATQVVKMILKIDDVIEPVGSE